jgi:hypothetical protein
MTTEKKINIDPKEWDVVIPFLSNILKVVESNKKILAPTAWNDCWMEIAYDPNEISIHLPSRWRNRTKQNREEVAILFGVPLSDCEYIGEDYGKQTFWWLRFPVKVTDK